MIKTPGFFRTPRGAMVAMAIGVSVYSIQDPIIKGLSDGYPVTQAIAFRGLFALPLFTLLVLNAGSIRMLWTKRPWTLIGRGGIQMSAYTAYYLSLPALPLTTAVALWFTAPLFMVALSQLMLGERQGRQRWLAVGFGFVGVLVIVHPTIDLSYAVFLPIAAAIFYAFGQLIARRVGVGIPTAVISWHQNTTYLVGSILLAGILAPFVQGFAGTGSIGFLLRPWAMPTLHDALLLGICGPIAAIGSTLIVYAYRSAPPGAVAPIEYLMMLWAVLWGFLIFNQLPDLLTLVGAALIIASGIYAITRPAPHLHEQRSSN